MTRKTSIEAYHEIKASGLLSKRRFEVYDALFHYGPMTQMETFVKLKHLSQHTVTPRFAELRKMGVIEEVGERACTVTGINVIAWDVTSSLPTQLPKGKTKTKIKKELISAIVSLGREIDDKWKSQLREMYKLVLQLTNK
jgi:hypothetical protein